MNDSMQIQCAQADEQGRRLVIATCGRRSHRDRFDTDDSFRRQRFAEAALAKFDWEASAEQIAEIDAKLVSEADREDARRPQADAVCLANVAATDVCWLWPGRIALGKVTLLAGDPGLGKSFVTLDIAARVSRGTVWPDELQGRVLDSLADPWRDEASGSVVLLSAEDDLADTIRPRLEAHGADCRRIIALRAITNEGQNARRWFDLGSDLVHLETLLDDLSDCRLVVIDPISAYLGRNVENANAEMRSLLAPLAALAAERHLAVLVVSHLRKGEGAAMYRTLGSMALVAACRSAWIVCRDPDDPRRRCLLLPVKNNLAGDVGGLAYSIEPLGPHGEPVVCWSAERVDAEIDQVLAKPRQAMGRPAESRRDAADWLQQRLVAGPQAAPQLIREGAALGWSDSTCHRALRMIGGQAVRRGNATFWQLTPVPDAPDLSEVGVSDF
jgi:putative DNA primase/helicase